MAWKGCSESVFFYAIEQAQRQGYRRVDGVGLASTTVQSSREHWHMYRCTQVTGGISSLDELHVLVEHGHVVEARPPHFYPDEVVGGIDARKQR